MLQANLDKASKDAQVARAERDTASAQLELLKLKGSAAGGDSSRLQGELDAVNKQFSQMKAEMAKEVRAPLQGRTGGLDWHWRVEVT